MDGYNLDLGFKEKENNISYLLITIFSSICIAFILIISRKNK